MGTTKEINLQRRIDEVLRKMGPGGTERELLLRPEFRIDLFRSYGPGKFGSYADAYAYELSLDGADEEISEGDRPYLLVRGPFDHPQLRKYAGAIVTEGDTGFVDVVWFSSKAKMESEWRRIEREIEQAMEPEGEDL